MGIINFAIKIENGAGKIIDKFENANQGDVALLVVLLEEFAKKRRDGLKESLVETKLGGIE